MDFENKIPEWKNEGTEPSEELRTKGFEARYKPPAAFFNWFWSKVIKCITEIQNKFKSHAENKSNPHGVTKAQVGLGNVDNVKQASKTEFDNLVGHFGGHIADFENPHNVTAEQVGLGTVTQDIAKLDTRLTGLGSEIVEHTFATNPHGVTKEQVGLGNVENVRQASYTEFKTHQAEFGNLEVAFNAHNSNKSNPHGVTAEQIGATPLTRVVFGLSTNIKDYAMTLERGFYAIHLTGTDYTGTDLPTGNYKYGSAIIYVRIKGDVITIMLLGSDTNPPQFAHCNDGVWGEWSTQFLPITGGVMKGNLDFKKVDNGSATIYKNHNESADYGLIIRDVATNGDYNQIYLCATENSVKYRDTAGKTNHLFGGHNKPSGSYTGNGNANRTINIGGSGRMLFVYSSSDFFVAMPVGGFYTSFGTNSNVLDIPSTSIKFDNGILTIGTQLLDVTNKQGDTYYYQVL